MAAAASVDGVAAGYPAGSAAAPAEAGLPTETRIMGIQPTSITTVYCNDNLRSVRVLRPMGVVRGVVVRSRNAIASIGAGFKSMVGGEIKTYTTLCEGARQQALERMLANAVELGANGVIGVRYDTNLIAQGMTEVIAYGTAVADGDAPPSSTTAPAGLADAANGGWISTMNEIHGLNVARSLGIVQGLTVRSRNAFAAIGAGLKSLVGGEIQGYTKMCEDCRKEAYDRMVAEAVELGADGILGVRYQTGEIVDGTTEVLCYGTAVSSSATNEPGSAAPAGGLTPFAITTGNILPGLDIQQSTGIAQGITVRSSNMFANIGASFKTMVGGEIHTWTRMCKQSRDEAMQRMIANAQTMGAKGIVAMRYDNNQVNQGMLEVVCYGTVVTDAEPAADVAILLGSHNFVTSDLEIPGHQVYHSFGIVRGVSVQSVNLFLNIGAGLKAMVGGEIRNYTDMCNKARDAAVAQMMEHATQMGATGIVGFRYECNDLVPGTIEVIAYGTAVSLVDDPARHTVEPVFQYGIDVSLVSTTNKLVRDDTTRSLGVVRGITVRSRNIAANFGAGLKAGFVGGEITTWRDLCDTARVHSYERMLEEAAKLGAKGIVAMRFETNELMPGITEVLTYGTAVA